MLYGRLVNEKGVRQFGVHAPGCTEDNRICAGGMVQCPDSDMHSLSLKMRRLVSETYRPSEIEYVDMPSADWIPGADTEEADSEAKAKRAKVSRENAVAASRAAMGISGKQPRPGLLPGVTDSSDQSDSSD